MSLDQGQNDAAAFAVPPQRTPVEFDPESNGLRIGPYERRIDDPSDSEQVFGAYISLLYAVRGAQPGEQLKLRSADLEALLAIVGDDPETIEQRLIALMGCTAQEARVLGGALLRHRRLTATLGIAGALALGGSLAGDDLFSGTSEAPRAAVVQSVADGLRALDDAGASRGSVSFAAPASEVAPASVSPAAVSMPADDWTGSKPVGGTPDVPAGTSSGPDGGAPAAPVAGVPAGTPAAPAAAAPSVVEPPAAAESPVLAAPAAPPVVVTNPVPVVESVVEQPGSGALPSANDAGAGDGAAAPVDSTSTADTDPLVDSDPLVDGTPPGDTTSSADPTIPVVDDSEAAPVTGGPAVPGTGSAPGLDGALPPGAERVPDGVTPPGLGGALPGGAAAAPGTSNAPGLGGTPPGGGNGMPGAIDVLPGVPLVLPPPPPVVVTPVVDPTVHDNRDKLKNTNSGGGNDGVDVDRDDNGKHSQTGEHVEKGNDKSNSAGGVVP